MGDAYHTAVEDRDTSIFDAGSWPASKHVTADDCRDGLREACARRTLAEALRADAMADIATWAAAGQHAGLAIAEIARLGGVTRQTVYTLAARSSEKLER